MSLALSAPPIQTELIEGPKSPFITKPWATWLRALVDRTQASATAITSAGTSLTAQTASLGLTSLVPAASAGVYRVSWRFRVTTAATTSSSLLVTLTTTEGGIVCEQSSVAYTGNATDEPQSGMFLVQPDGGSPVQISTTYASVGGTAMAYTLDVRVEQL